MSDDGRYTLGSAQGARVHREGERWILEVERRLQAPPERVWSALVEPALLRGWSPFDADGRLAEVGGAVLLTDAGTPHVSEANVTRADAPHVLEYSWGGAEMRWILGPGLDGGTQLRLWNCIDREFIALGAAGWHVCLDVLARLLDGAPVGRIVGAQASRLEGWSRLHAEYARLIGVTPPESAAKG